ncbi:MAG TPA: outer membrane lipid asymmetry maintenance protein MlaD [Methylomirabilota bacterium]|jgi:phospholipid/cholesterol/gamma-HCH transport system substrate-binding protein|nr:outer membrane lipid asymmetry maintenance protein MlaD [Methylomirabilota bacterium]
MRRSLLDLAVGVFVLLGILALGWLSIKLGKIDFVGGHNYTVTADFPSAGGLKNGSSIEIAGVEIGRVSAVQLANYQARVVMSIRNGVKLTEDSIASIKTRGLIGEKFINLSPGGSDRIIKPGGKITEVEPPIDLEELLSKYVFGKV